MTADFLDRLLAVEDAWSMLDAVEGSEDKVRQIERAVTAGGHATQVLIRAGEMLAGLGEAERARETLQKGVALDGPTAPLQAALARQLRTMGDLDGAALWLRGTMLRARPDARLLTTLASIELEAGRAGCAEALLAAAVRFRTNDAAGLAIDGRQLWALGRPDLAMTPFVLAYARGYRDEAYLADFGRLLALDGMPVIDEALQLQAGAQAAHYKLSAVYFADPRTVRLAQERETSRQWVFTDDMVAFLRAAIARGEPFSWIRLGESEARFLLCHRPEMRGPLTDGEIEFVGRYIWRNWHGADIRRADPARLEGLAKQLEEAIVDADLLGVPSSPRFANEPEHTGSLAALDRHMERLAPRGRYCEFFDSLILNERVPFYADILEGIDFIGSVGPHAGLAELLARQLGIPNSASYVIPGESRLGRPQDAADRGTHFPEVFDRLMKEIRVPHRGAVFLVAGGMLGKLYCDRIKQLGGIAFDIGAVVDAWMGYNTRGVVLDRSMGHRLVP
ncbi:tetratricopeptide repeat protein [Rhizorhabdus dicambivorans]|nr:hypothetical protein [Rhizorhabdus dicambivorans]